MIKRIFQVSGFMVLLVLAACRPAQPAAEPLPTLAVLPGTPAFDLTDAQRVALAFMDAWQSSDFETMYSWLSFASQEATPFERFVRFYQDAATTMTLTSLDYTGTTLYRERDDIAVFGYDMTFHTNLLDDFSDTNRELRLVVDQAADGWRVAWGVGNIFPEMVDGAQLRLDLSRPSRANIYDRNDQILADQNGRVVAVSAVKQEIPNWNGCLNYLSPAVLKEVPLLQKIYDESGADWLMALGTIEPATWEQTHTQLEEACAARFTSLATRRYINGVLAPHILGNVGYPLADALPDVLVAGFNQDSILGQSGIEASWDSTLRGVPGASLQVISQRGEILRELARSAPQPSESVWLTIDSGLQTATQRILEAAYTAAADGWAKESKGAAAVVMDVNTGAILAMVSYPTFDNNLFNPYPQGGRYATDPLIQAIQDDPRRPQINRVTQGLYPLGSVMKTVSAVAAADSGVYALDQRYVCTGIWAREANFIRTDWDPNGHGSITLPQAITQSCNPYFWELSYQVNLADPNTLPDYMHRFGFGTPTGLTDLTEAAGFIPDPEWKELNLGLPWTLSDAANIVIGQGEVQVTPLQVVRWFAAVANGGTFYRPQLVQKVGILGEAPSATLQPDAMSRVTLHEGVLETLRAGMCDVTTARSGTAEYQFRESPLQNLVVCGKTGTAQDGSRADANSHAWFAAYAPRENPQVAVVIIVENSGEGSEVAAPIVRDILEYYFFGEP
jgi:penicillin-binding protein 2